nr:immunoglobulin light chain junction region [Macaca mulatta]
DYYCMVEHGRVWVF